MKNDQFFKNASSCRSANAPDIGATVLIGEALHAMYDRVIMEDMPDQFLSLLARLEDQEQSN